MGLELERGVEFCFSKKLEANYGSPSSYVFCIAPPFKEHL
jgi:hypothetical protein